MDNANLYNKINYNVSALDPANRTSASTILSFYRCPSYSGRDFSEDALYTGGMVSFTQFAIRNYVALGAKSVFGLSGMASFPAEGTMYPGSKTRIRDITDGTTNTILIAETRDQNSSVWIDGTSASVCARWFAPPSTVGNTSAINYKPYFPGGYPGSITQEYGPSSQHSGGAQHLLGDESVRMISENINVALYEGLVSRAGGEVVSEF